MKWFKKPIPSKVEFAKQTGSLLTLEGVVSFEAGDALMTGVRGERWPIQRTRFEATYELIPPTRMGENGPYLKKHMLVEARQATQEERVHLPGGNGPLRARVEDWVLTAPDGHQWVVANDIFIETYQVAKPVITN